MMLRMPVYDPADISTDPEVLRRRLAEHHERTARLIATAFDTRAEAQAACKPGQSVVEIHGLAGFFVR